MKLAIVAMRMVSVAGKWGSVVALLFLAACESEAMRWKEDVLLPDGRTVTLTRYQEFKGPHEIGDAPSASNYSFEFKHPDTGRTIRWEYGRHLGTVALMVDREAVYLLSMPRYGSSLRQFGCPNPPYVLFRLRTNWERVALSEIPVKVLRANMTYSVNRDRKKIEQAHGYLSKEITQAATLNHRPWIMDFSGVAQSVDPGNCHKPYDYLIVPASKLEGA